MMDRLEFRAFVPSLPIDSGCRSIKNVIASFKDGPNLNLLTLTGQEFKSFLPHLESNWSLIHDLIPQYFHELLAGNWPVDEWRNIPKSLLGDFGEFFGCKVYQNMHNSGQQSRVCRIIRAADLKRPDFLIHANNQLTALECKASAINAKDWRFPQRRQSFCAQISRRRNKGREQIALHLDSNDPAGVIQIANQPVQLPPGPVNDYGRSLVIAHNSAIITPLFPDGRLMRERSNSNHWKNNCKSATCPECLGRDGVPMPVVCPVFQNSPKKVIPLLPLGMDIAEFFEAYLDLSKALWTVSSDKFSEAWIRLLWVVERSENLHKKIYRPFYLQFLLDVLAAGLEAGFLVSEKSIVQIEKIFIPLYKMVAPLYGLESLREAMKLQFQELGTGYIKFLRSDLPVDLLGDKSPWHNWSKFWLSRGTGGQSTISMQIDNYNDIIDQISQDHSQGGISFYRSYEETWYYPPHSRSCSFILRMAAKTLTSALSAMAGLEEAMRIRFAPQKPNEIIRSVQDPQYAELILQMKPFKELIRMYVNAEGFGTVIFPQIPGSLEN